MYVHSKNISQFTPETSLSYISYWHQHRTIRCHCPQHYGITNEMLMAVVVWWYPYVDSNCALIAHIRINYASNLPHLLLFGVSFLWRR